MPSLYFGDSVGQGFAENKETCRNNLQLPGILVGVKVHHDPVACNFPNQAVIVMRTVMPKIVSL
jgi:hypothetical protein